MLIDDVKLPVRDLLGKDITRSKGKMETKIELDFSTVKLTKNCYPFMAELLKKNTHLKTLNKLCMENKEHFNAARYGLKEYELEFVGQRMRANKNFTKSMDLTSNILKGEAIFILSRSLNPMPALTKLDLSYNNLGPMGAEYIAKSLEIGDGLLILKLSYNSLGDEGIICISKSLIFNNNLEVLDIAGNNIGDKGIKMLAAALQKNKSIKKLNLRWNVFGPDSVSLIANALTLVHNWNL